METIDTPADPVAPEAQPVSYIAYDADTGALLGGFLQVPPENHAQIIEVSDEVRSNWTAYRLNTARDGVELAPPVPPAPPAVPDYVTAIQAMLDTKVQERRYYNILSACTYATDTNPTFKAEGQACVEWRGAVWAKAYATLDEVTAGTIPQPTIDELLATLPTMTWPS